MEKQTRLMEKLTNNLIKDWRSLEEILQPHQLDL